MFKRKGFTLLELIIVVIIIGVLAGIAIPQYLNAVEKAKVSKAKANLVVMNQAERFYHAEQSIYTTTLTELEAVLQGVEGTVTSDPDWTYSIPTATATQFTVQASRNAGTYTGNTIILDEKNALTGTHPLK